MTGQLRTLEEIAGSFDTDKSASKNYLAQYTRFFEASRDAPVALLELGVLRGGSLLTWNEYFPRGRIVGLDVSPNPFTEQPERVRFYQGSQADLALLDRIGQENAPEGFDFIIDDAAHVGALSRVSFERLFTRHLKPGGVYVVEDWGTGYWPSWPDGRGYGEALGAGGEFPSHHAGMVGFVKQLVDWVGWYDVSHPNRGDPALRCPVTGIRELAVFMGQVFVVKG